MKHATLSRTVVFALGLALMSGSAAWADNGIAKCKDGTVGQGPSVGAAKFCESHGGLESWVALLVKPGELSLEVYEAPRGAAKATE